ncbi:hypothetical protein EMCRGX_G017135 [Ephydatia muelleri]
MLSLIAAASLLFIALLVYKFAYAPYGALRKMGVNGPTPRPFWGNAREFIEDFFVHGVNEKLGLPPSIVISRGEEWKNSRQAFSPTFTGGKMKQMIPVLLKCVDNLQADLETFAVSGETIDIKSHFGVFITESILAVAFGRQVDLHSSDGPEDPLTKATRTFFDLQRPGSEAPNIFTIITLRSQLPFISHLMPYFVPKAMEDSFRFLYETAKALIKTRRDENNSVKHDDFLQLMLDLETENGSTQNATPTDLFSNNDLISHCITFLLAGQETTASCLAYTSYLLAINPDVQEKLCQELDNYFKDHSISTGIYEATHDIKYLDMVVQESLRLFPPAALIVGRMSTDKVQLGGLDIPKGTAVIVPVMSIHQDQKIWEDPENFKPERFAAEEKQKRPQLCHLPFGWGPRNCVGMRFALMEAKMTLIRILQKYKFVRALETEVPLQTIMAGLILQPKNGIFLKIQPRN